MQSFLAHNGYIALILLAFLEACCAPISSEVVFGFAGVLAYQGRMNLAAVIVAGTLAEMAGSYVSYTVGRVAERPVVERFGRYLLITKTDLDRAERFLTGRGGWAIPLSRILPLVRSFASLVAGFSGVRAVRFGVLSFIGTVIYVTTVSSIGYGLGSAWNRVAHDLSEAGYVIAALVVLAIVAFIIIRVRELRRESAEAAEQPAGYRTPPPASHRARRDRQDPGRDRYDPRQDPGRDRYDPRQDPGQDRYDPRQDPGQDRYDPRQDPGQDRYDPRQDPGQDRYDPRQDPRQDRPARW
jgi:membrane protein DedA with SNARE-associated domain